MQEGLIPRRYAKALYKFAQEHDATRTVYDKMLKLEQQFESQPALQEVMDNPYVSSDDKIKLLSTAAAIGDNETILSNFFKLLRENKRFEMARAIAIAYRSLFRIENNIHQVHVTSAAPLEPQEEKRLKDVIERHLNGGSMEYSDSVDPELIGGFVVKIDNKVLDASISNELKQLRIKLLSNN